MKPPRGGFFRQPPKRSTNVEHPHTPTMTQAEGQAITSTKKVIRTPRRETTKTANWKFSPEENEDVF